jgi:hypothetical protein
VDRVKREDEQSSIDIVHGRGHDLDAAMTKLVEIGSIKGADR